MKRSLSPQGERGLRFGAVPRSARITLITALTALLCFGVGGFFSSPLSHGISNEVQDRWALFGMFGWFASHAVGAPAGIIAWKRSGAFVAFLTVLHVAFLFVSGAIAGFLLLLSGSHFH